MPSKLDFLIAKIEAFKIPLKSLGNKEKVHHVPVELASNFNKIREDIILSIPESESELPNAINLFGQFVGLSGNTDITYTALEIIIEQVIAVLQVFKAGH